MKICGMIESHALSRSQSIKRVILNRATGRYFVEQEGGGWVDSPEDATQYEKVSRMVEVCRDFGLEDVDLVLKFDCGEPVESIAIR